MNKPSKDQVRAGVIGAVVMLAIVVFLAGTWAGDVVWVRAYHGEIAFEEMADRLRAQQPVQSKMVSPPPAKSPTP